jgi:hypothetical protein
MKARKSPTKVSIAMETIVASRSSHAQQDFLSRRNCNFRDNTYNNDSYLDEADMNS